MFYRFYINDKKFFLDNYSFIMDSLKKYKRDNLLKYIHLIVPDLLISDIKDRIENDIQINTEIILYSSLNSVIDNGFGVYYNKSKLYNQDLDQDTLLVIYIQEVKGYVARDLNLNKIVELKSNFDFILEDKIIGNMKKSFFGEYSMNDNIYIGLYGRCNRCLNCLCDMNKTKNGIKFLIDHEECKFKKELHDRIPKEVKEVTYEQYNHIIELLTEVLKQSSFDHSVIITQIDEIKNSEVK